MENSSPQNFEPSQQPPVNPASSAKRIISIIIPVAVLIVILIAIGYLVLNKQPNKQQVTTNQETTTEITDWKTYVDNAIGIVVKFPANWYLISASGSPGSFELSNVSRSDWTSSYKMQNASFFRVGLRAFDNKLPIEQWYEEYFSRKPLLNITEKKIVTVAELPAIMVKTTNNYTGIEYKAINYFIAKGGHVIDIQFSYNNSNHLKTYQVILDNLELFNITIPTGSYKISNNNISQTIIEGGVNENDYALGYNNILMPEGYSENGELIFTSRAGTQHPVPDNIDKKIETITGMVVNSLENDLVFISGSNYFSTSDISSCINKLYTYNLKTGELVEFYSETSKDNSPRGPSSCKILRAVGTQGSKLILLTDNPENSPGPCTSIWSDYKDKFLYLELSNIKGGLQKFIVPDYKVSEGNEFVSQCLEDFKNNGGI